MIIFLKIISKFLVDFKIKNVESSIPCTQKCFLHDRSFFIRYKVKIQWFASFMHIFTHQILRSSLSESFSLVTMKRENDNSKMSSNIYISFALIIKCLQLIHKLIKLKCYSSLWLSRTETFLTEFLYVLFRLFRHSIAHNARLNQHFRSLFFLLLYFNSLSRDQRNFR